MVEGLDHHVIRVPGTDIVAPDPVHELRPEGFMLHFGPSDEVLVDMLQSTDASSQHRVIARLAFTYEGFQQFVDGLRTVQKDL
jgi:hypothetical protein